MASQGNSAHGIDPKKKEKTGQQVQEEEEDGLGGAQARGAKKS